MKPAPFVYYDPRSVEEAVGLLGRLENARLLSGGQSLMPMMNFRLVMPDHLIDLNRIDALASIDVKPTTARFGGMTRQCDIEYSVEIGRACPILHEALSHVGHRQTRNRGTIGGSLCHLDPSAELANMTLLHDGTIEAQGPKGARKLKMADFAVGYMTHALAPDEMLTGIEFALWPRTHGYAFEEFARRHGDFAIAAVGALVELNASGAIERASLALSGVGPVPVRVVKAEALLRGQKPAHELYRAAAEASAAEEAMSDAYVTAEYRKHLARILTYRALARAVERAGERRKLG